MEKNKIAQLPHKFKITPHIILLFTLWTVVILVLVSINIFHLQQTTREIAIREARSNFNKDQAIRSWSTTHGGVYVPIAASTPPNPYLSHVQERDLTSPVGKKLTLMNPAYMIRQMNENFAEEYGVQGHITSLKPLRPENKADAWEKMALESFELGIKEVVEFTEVNGRPFVRLMQPMKTKQGCLKCHAHQGYKAGDIRGGVAIALPLDSLIESQNNNIVTQSVSLFILWLFGSCFVFFEGNRLKKLAEVHNNTLENVQEMKERLEFVVKGARVGTWDLNVQTGELLLNKRWADMLGYTLDEIKPHTSSWEKLLHPDDLKKTTHAVTELIEGHTPSYMTEHRLRHKSGQWIWILSVGKVLKWGHDGKALRAVGIHIDITNQKEQEIQRFEVSLQKEQLEKLESLKTMAGAIAHRFNNAMMAVQGNLELMKLTLPDGSEEYKMASNAAKAASGASQVGSMMLSYVGQQPLQLQTISISNLVGESVTALKDLFHPLISLKFYPPDQDLYCSIDQAQIKEVLASLLTNAIESLGNNKGTIEITFGTEYYVTSSFPLSFHGENIKDGIYSFCQIKDTGHGIDPENMLRIFEPFYTTRFVGRGLGLALTVGVMQSHNGAITVESSSNKGTIVRVLLPSIDPLSQRKIHSSREEGDAVQLSGNILLADDEKMVLEVAGKMLIALGYIVHTAMDGQEAVDKVLKKDTDYCAVILDISMPKLDGIDAMQTIRKINPALPIILSSGYSEDEFSFEEEQGGKPDAFLSKPFHLSDMRNSLEKLLS